MESKSLLRSQDLQSLGVDVTEVPPSVTNLLDCVAHEIKVIENDLNQCYNNHNNYSAAGDGNPGGCDKEERLRMEALEDAFDDGFMCVDLKVLERKLEVWHRLFSPSFCSTFLGTKTTTGVVGAGASPPAAAAAAAATAAAAVVSEYNYTVTPFFAVKCNPDPLVVEWLARSSLRKNLPLGFDCASIAELELAKRNIEKYFLTSVYGQITHQNNNNNNNNNILAVPTTRIVYANPQRAEADLIKAMELFATKTATTQEKQPNYELWLTLDGVEEVYKIAIAKERFRHKHQNVVQMPPIKIVLRIWVPDGHSQVPLGEKFGMRLDQIDSVIRACLDQNISPSDIIGISFHCGSGCESVETYLEALDMGKKALQSMDKVLLEASKTKSDDSSLPQHRCWLMDIGGGFPGLDGLYGDEGRFASKVLESSASSRVTTTSSSSIEEENKRTGSCATLVEKEPDAAEPQTTVANIAVAVRSVLHSFASGNESSNQPLDVPLTLIAEPGRYFVEGAFALASKIYQKQILPHKETSTEGEQKESSTVCVYRIPHGVQGVFKDVLLCGESFVPQPLQQMQPQQEGPKKRQLYRSKVLGPSGDDSEDVVCEVCWLPELEIGDWLVFDRMGAYTLSIASRAGRPVMRYVMGGGAETRVRSETTT